MKVSLLTIGDEILIGQIVDTNSAWMAQQLNLIGARIQEMRSIGDEYAAIHQTLQNALELSDVVLITGGLGPTKDDITKKALADFFGTELVFHEPSFVRLERFFQRIGRPMVPALRQQAFLPANTEVLINKMGTAPGMWFDYHGKVIVAMPGVPYEMQYLMENEVLPRLKAHFPGQPIVHRTLLTAGEGESNIALRLEDFEQNLPPYIKLAYLPNLAQVRLRLTAIGEDEAQLNRELDAKAAEIRELLGDLIYGTEQESLEQYIGKLLLEQNSLLATAESCTGGYLAHLITAIPGASAYFQGSVIAYANAIKEDVLGVSPQTLATHGAVSEATVREMVPGALRVTGADVAVAISGIAGPDGGTPEKPVGTIWLAVGDRQHTQTLLLKAGKDRVKNIQYASYHALNFLRHFLLNRRTMTKP